MGNGLVDTSKARVSSPLFFVKISLLVPHKCCGKVKKANHSKTVQEHNFTDCDRRNQHMQALGEAGALQVLQHTCSPFDTHSSNASRLCCVGGNTRNTCGRQLHVCVRPVVYMLGSPSNRPTIGLALQHGCTSLAQTQVPPLPTRAESWGPVLAVNNT